MSHQHRATSSSQTTKVARLTQALRRNWTQARLTDRELMALRTNISRHAA